jgi:hypothetical protein
MFNPDKLVDFGIYTINWLACKLNVNRQSKVKTWYEVKYEDYLKINTFKVFAISEEQALFELFDSLDWYIPDIKSIELVKKVTLPSTSNLKPYADNYLTKELNNPSYVTGSNVKVYYTDLVTGKEVVVAYFKTIELSIRNTEPYLTVNQRIPICLDIQFSWVAHEGNIAAIAETIKLSDYFNIQYTATDNSTLTLNRTKIDCYSKLNYPNRIEGIGGTLTRQPTTNELK